VLPPPEGHPYLRNTRIMEAGQVFTIEPGIYFVEMLLEPFRAGASSVDFNWPLIDQLAPFGGIRVEDNVVVTSNGHRNLTREHLPN
jgi:Xaa-Pro dipeptidase